MSLYRQAGRASGRTVLIAAAAALVVGLLAGFLLGRSTAPKPSLADKVADLPAGLAPAREGLRAGRSAEAWRRPARGSSSPRPSTARRSAPAASSRRPSTAPRSPTSSARPTRSL